MISMRRAIVLSFSGARIMARTMLGGRPAPRRRAANSFGSPTKSAARSAVPGARAPPLGEFVGEAADFRAHGSGSDEPDWEGEGDFRSRTASSAAFAVSEAPRSRVEPLMFTGEN